MGTLSSLGEYIDIMNSMDKIVELKIISNIIYQARI